MSGVKSRYSKQRETIYETLKHDTTHPHVDSIYTQVKKQIPDISLGTVYRNLNFLVDQKRIRRLDCGDGVVHFDANLKPHYHMVCDECGAVTDLMLNQQTIDSLMNNVEQQCDVTILGIDILFHGLCHHCQSKKS